MTAGQEHLLLKKGDLLFHQPNEFHAVKADGKTAPNLMVASFCCVDDASMEFFRQRQRFQIDKEEHSLLAAIIAEARWCFACRLDDPYLQNMPLKTPDKFGAQQMIRPEPGIFPDPSDPARGSGAPPPAGKRRWNP